MKTEILFLAAILLLSFGCADNDDLSEDDNAAKTEVKDMTGTGKIVGYSKCYDTEKDSTLLGIFIITEASDSLLTFNIPLSFFDLDINQLKYGVYNMDGDSVSFSYKKTEAGEIKYDFFCSQNTMDLGFRYPVENFTQIIIKHISSNMNERCKFENPLTDLPWLKAKVDEITLLSQNNPLYITIYQCIYGNGETGFLVDEGNMKPFYSCNGKVLCIMGGFAGETCSELNVVSKVLIWEINN
jgi:hypothetical protein